MELRLFYFNGLITKLYILIRILSIDVVVGTLVMTGLFGFILNTDLLPIYYICVGLSVWLTYTLDHLLDAKKIGHQAKTDRHRFHQRHYRVLLNIWYITFISALLFAVFYLPTVMLIAGLVITCLVLVHFIFIKVFGERLTVFLQKELMVALIYCSGVSFGPILKAGIIDTEVIVTLIEVFLLALINLLEFSFFEYDVDKKDNHSSFVRLVGPNKARKVVLFLLVATYILVGLSGFMLTGNKNFGVAQIVIFCMTLVLTLVIIKPTFFMRNERYRIYGDLIFLFPMMVLLF